MKILEFYSRKFVLFFLVVIPWQSTLVYALDAPLKQPLDPSKASESVSAADPPSECPGDVPQHALVECMRDESERYDQEVIKEFNSVIALLPQADLPDEAKGIIKRQLTAVQHEWEIYRKLDCESRVAFLDNSDSATLEYWDCMRNHSRRRRLDLHLFLNN